MFVLFVLKYLFVFYSKHQFLHWFFPYSIVKDQFRSILFELVGLDGLEPSTSRLSGARSNHLSYRPFWTHLVSVRPSRRFPDWWRWRESNPWPPACRAGALPAELHPHIGFYISPWQLNNRCLYTAQYASNPVLRLWPWMSLRFFRFCSLLSNYGHTTVPFVLCWPRSP